MGMLDSAYWGSWIFNHLLTNTLMVLILTGACAAANFQQFIITDYSLVFFTFWYVPSTHQPSTASVGQRRRFCWGFFCFFGGGGVCVCVCSQRLWAVFLGVLDEGWVFFFLWSVRSPVFLINILWLTLTCFPMSNAPHPHHLSPIHNH